MVFALRLGVGTGHVLGELGRILTKKIKIKTTTTEMLRSGGYWQQLCWWGAWSVAILLFYLVDLCSLYFLSSEGFVFLLV